MYSIQMKHQVETGLMFKELLKGLLQQLSSNLFLFLQTLNITVTLSTQYHTPFVGIQLGFKKKEKSHKSFYKSSCNNLFYIVFLIETNSKILAENCYLMQIAQNNKTLKITF